MKKMHLKKKKNFYKFFLFIFCIALSYLISFGVILKNKTLKDDKYIDFLLNASFEKNIKYKFMVNESIKFLSKMDFTQPSTLLDNKIAKAEVKPLKSSNKIQEETNQVFSEKKENPIIYIYNSHQHETYDGDPNNKSDVIMVSKLLKEKLKENNIDSVVEESSVMDFINASGISYNKFYGTTRIFIENIKKEYPNIKYFIDVHRDGVEKNLSTITIDEKNYAKLLFVIASSNPNYLDNESEAKKISDKVNQKYNGLSRGIFHRNDGTPNLYNQDISRYALLIEVGANENTTDEVKNTVEVLGNAISEYIKENE